MDGVTLLAEARAAGLAVGVEGDRLVVRGPKKARAVAERLCLHMDAVLAALRGGDSHNSQDSHNSAWDDASAWRLFHHTNERIVSQTLPPGAPWDGLWWERSEAMTARDWPRLVAVCAEMVTAAGVGPP